MPNFSYHSYIGKPFCPLGDPEITQKFFAPLGTKTFTPGYYSKNQTIHGISLQENEFFAHKKDFFSKYQVYENFNGWNTQGQIHLPNLKLVKRGHHLMGYSAKPILVGDLYGTDLESVIWAQGFYDPRFALFKVRFQLGTIPTLTITAKQNSFHQELKTLENLLVEGFHSVSNALEKFKDCFNIVNVGTPTDGWASPPHSVAFNIQVQLAQNQIQKQTQEIQKQMEKIQELRW